MNEKLQKLKAQGFEVNCLHFRYPQNGDSLLLASEMRNANIKPSSNGGLTVLTLRSQTGKTYHSSAQCCKKDNFSHKRGFQIALERAIDRMKIVETKQLK